MIHFIGLLGQEAVLEVWASDRGEKQENQENMIPTNIVVLDEIGFEVFLNITACDEFMSRVCTLGAHV